MIVYYTYNVLSLSANAPPILNWYVSQNIDNQIFAHNILVFLKITKNNRKYKEKSPDFSVGALSTNKYLNF